MFVRITLAILLLFVIAAWHDSASLPSLPSETQKKEETVAFNVKSHKYHCLSCYHAKKCTANCIRIAISEARQRGTPCKICGGTCE